MNPIEVVAVVFGLLCVWLCVKENIWCWPTGLVQVSLYVIIFYQAKLYSDTILNVIYVGVQFYGWYHWLHGGRDRGELAVSRLSAPALNGWIVVTVVGTALWGYGMASLTDAAVPYWDAFTTVASLVAQWLMARKRVENWAFWIAVDVVAVGVYLYKGLHLTAGLYFVFLIMCIEGWRAWNRTVQETTPSAVPVV